jgi:hypothetical protein
MKTTTFSEREKRQIREIIKSGISLLGHGVEIRDNGAFIIRIAPKPGQVPMPIHTSRMTSIRWAESNEKQITVRLHDYKITKYEYELSIDQFKQAIREAKLSKLGV